MVLFLLQEEIIMYYGYRCYNKSGEALGWFYTYNSDTEYSYTNKDFAWCKRWKSMKGAEKNFDNYNKRWQAKTNGGYLKIEEMPEASTSQKTNTQTLIIFKSEKYMSNEQLSYAQDFEAKIREEASRCAYEISKAQKLVSCEKVEKGAEENINLACNEIKAIQKYWTDRLCNLLNLIESRNSQLHKELSDKYLN